MLFYFLRCLVRLERRQELLSPNCGVKKPRIELSPCLAYDPPVAYAARSRSSLWHCRPRTCWQRRDCFIADGMIRVRLPLRAVMNWDDP